MKINWYMPLPQDKANHYAGGSIVFLATYAALRLLGVPGAKHSAMAVAVLVGAVKELVDHVLNLRAIAAGKKPPHGVDGGDFVATVCGALPLYAVAA